MSDSIKTNPPRLFQDIAFDQWLEENPLYLRLTHKAYVPRPRWKAQVWFGTPYEGWKSLLGIIISVLLLMGVMYMVKILLLVGIMVSGFFAVLLHRDRRIRQLRWRREASSGRLLDLWMSLGPEGIADALVGTEAVISWKKRILISGFLALYGLGLIVVCTKAEYLWPMFISGTGAVICLIFSILQPVTARTDIVHAYRNIAYSLDGKLQTLKSGANPIWWAALGAFAFFLIFITVIPFNHTNPREQIVAIILTPVFVFGLIAGFHYLRSSEKQWGAVHQARKETIQTFNEYLPQIIEDSVNFENRSIYSEKNW